MLMPTPVRFMTTRPGLDQAGSPSQFGPLMERKYRSVLIRPKRGCRSQIQRMETATRGMMAGYVEGGAQEGATAQVAAIQDHGEPEAGGH